MPPAREIAALARTRHALLTIETREALQFVDLTDRIAEVVAQSGVFDGIVIVQSRHTTAGIMINEHEPLLLDDLRAMFERLVPEALGYAHDDFARRACGASERPNGHAHCRAALLRTSETAAIHDGRLALGRWQRIFLVEFDGGQRREIGVTILNSG
jgi:secondary thiamine-phosphate synthase enzyme